MLESGFRPVKRFVIWRTKIKTVVGIISHRLVTGVCATGWGQPESTESSFKNIRQAFLNRIKRTVEPLQNRWG